MARQDKAIVAKQAGGEADRHRPCSKRPAEKVAGTGLVANSRQMIRPAQALQKNTAGRRSWPASCLVQWRLVEGVRWCWPLGRRARTYPTVSLPTYRLCLSLSIPTPLICKQPNLAPTFFFCFILFLLFPYKFVSLFLYSLCPANLSCLLAYSQPLRSLPGGE